MSENTGWNNFYVTYLVPVVCAPLKALFTTEYCP